MTITQFSPNPSGRISLRDTIAIADATDAAIKRCLGGFGFSMVGQFEGFLNTIRRARTCG